MFHRVIAGVDGSPSGRDAVALAQALAMPGERVTLAHVYGQSPLRAQTSRDGRETSLVMLEQERDAMSADANLVAVAASSVGRGLHALAETDGADLLTLGSCARGFAGRVLVGNDTRASLIGAPCAVAIAPLGYAQAARPLSSIGVGYDGSVESEAALELARELAGRDGAEVHVLEVVQIPALGYAALGGVYWGEALETLRSDAQTRVNALEGVEGSAVLGLAGEELAAFGARVDLLVVGSRGYGPVRRLILGSTSEYLASHARCPLVVLPRQVSSDPDSPVGFAEHAAMTAI